MSYLIQVFNANPIETVQPAEVLAAITESNYATLCAQYGLDPALIPDAKAQLQVLAAPASSGAPFFTATYGGERPLVVTYQDWAGGRADGLEAVSEDVRLALSRTRQAVSVSLEREQLKDLGLLLGYELARWAAVQGHGIMRSLDGRWYRLNAYKAFLPLDS